MTVNRRLHAAKVILEQLIEKPQRWTELEKATVRASPTFLSFRSTLEWLPGNSYVQRLSRGAYDITDRGRIFPRALWLIGSHIARVLFS